MKWYSIKEYIPQTDVDLIIRAINFDDYERYFIAYVELNDGIENLVNWDMGNVSYHDFDFKIYTVTHFAIIDPVERRQ